MKIEEKNQLIDSITEELKGHNTIYVADISNLDAVDTFKLRKLCFNKNVKLAVVKNTLLKKAMEKTEKDLGELYEILKGPTSIMLSDTANAPAKLIREFRKNSDKPVLKGAYVEEMVFIGDEQLTMLSEMKSKEELVADVIALLQSPAKNVISGLLSGGQKITGILETLSEKSE
ncbi:MAG: 50S ribosomal protein L10 [Bacteroidales bacterium]|nr:50S ribosomal protein L10 [Bacteroidales bacterium]MCF8350034.1 50S ribosomal protein L10 [Bacteroidales bacterium]MCF8375190.1 50S ribosomal protein L10 [Bacteroidales bacterium]MCF8400688.1 50S ribosomal protein L10 [Bacteroidales bacterium]